MIYLLYGSDTTRSQKKLEEIAEEYRKKYGNLNVHKFDAEEEALEKIKGIFETNSLFSAKKLVILKYFSQSPQKDEFYKVLKEIKDDPETTVILWDREIAEKELGKLRGFCQKLQEFKETKRELPEASVFELGDTFFTRPKTALFNLLRLLNQGHDDFNLFSYLTNHGRTLLAVKSYSESGRSVPASHKIHPFVVKKAGVLVKFIPQGHLESSSRAFFKEDHKIKTGLSSPKDSLINILVSRRTEK